MISLIALILTVNLSDLAEHCARGDKAACQERDRALATTPAPAKQPDRKAALERQQAEVAAQDAADAAADAELRKACGKDYHRIKIGETWKRVQQCAGAFDWSITYQDAAATVYTAAGGFVRVERGRVTRWAAPPGV